MSLDGAMILSIVLTAIVSVVFVCPLLAATTIDRL